MRTMFVALTMVLTASCLYAEVAPTTGSDNGAAVTNFVNKFFDAYNSKDANALREMIVAGDREKERIIRGSNRSVLPLTKVIKSIDLQNLKVVVALSDTKISRSLEMNLICKDGNLKLKDCGFQETENKNKVFADALRLERLFCQSVNGADTNAVRRMLVAQSADAVKVEWQDLLKEHNLQWIDDAMQKKMRVAFKQIHVVNDDIFVAFTVSDETIGNKREARYIGYKGGAFTCGVNDLPQSTCGSTK